MQVTMFLTCLFIGPNHFLNVPRVPVLSFCRAYYVLPLLLSRSQETAQA